jgi:succinate-semialdehyde dehydrogenase / glutarate-semialdehyde dehydrogenase
VGTLGHMPFVPATPSPDLADDEQKVLSGVPAELFIGGEWRSARSGETFPVDDPATGRPLCEVADATADDAVAALDAAVEVRDGWATTPPRERGEILRRTYEALLDQRDDLALLMTLEMGKPLAESAAEVTYAAEFLRWFAEEAVRVDGRFTTEPNGRGRLLVTRGPVGPCYLITPWNFPMAMATRKIGPAVAAGCTMVVKPASLTPLCTLALARIMTDAGLPPGVLNVITTTSSGAVTEPLLSDPRLRKLSFTGSTSVGRLLAGQASENVLRVSMELGGNAPFLVFEDADLGAAVDGAVTAKMRNMGEACTAANRFLVHEDVAAEFCDRLAARLGEMVVGRGTESDSQVGPLIDQSAREKVLSLVDDAVGTGARVLTGGSAVDGPGWFMQPTVLADVPHGARILHDEVFGPVAPVTTFASDDEAVRAANDTEYGLVAYAYINDITRALRVVESLDAGMVGLNQGLVSNPAAPFGGVKQSGYGREGGREGIDEYLSTKYVAIATA